MSGNDWSFFVGFTHPWYLIALAITPLIVLLSIRSLAGLGPVRRALAIGLRCAVIAAMACALASPEWIRTTDDQSVVFAVDQSDSIPAGSRGAAWQFVQEAAARVRPDKDRVALLGFDGRAAVEQTARPELIIDRVDSPVEPHRTNIAGAIRLGLALLPADTARRLVVLSDGNENLGSAAEEAEACAAAGVPVDVVPLRYTYDDEILVDQLTAPATARRDEVINLQLVLRSQVAAPIRVLLYHNDQLVDLDPSSSSTGMPVDLAAGPTRLVFPVTLRSTGVHRFRAVVQPANAADKLPYNNEGRAFTIVGEADRVLVVTDTDATPVDATAASLLIEALASGGIECGQIAVEDLPADPASLADASTVILNNVSAFSLGEMRQSALASYVRDQGGGLIVIGGDRAFSVGGYAHTPLEDILPVETSRDKLKILSLSMIIVIDRSGSMEGEKIDMARQAAAAAVQLLSRFDRVGVIVFDGIAQWLVTPRAGSDKATIAAQLATLGAGGGTDMFPALQQAYVALKDATTSLKHIVVLTDGQSVPADFDSLAKLCAHHGITISTIAVGPDADRELLGRIATLTGGRTYVAEGARPLPQIFVRETVIASRSGLHEQLFQPRLHTGGDNGILQGFTARDIPALHGHVVTASKPLAQVPLVRTTEEDTVPVLACWQVGLGRVVAFTSGLWPKWGPDWVTWSGFSKVWTQAVRYAGRPANSSDLAIESTVKDGQAHVVISAEHLPQDVQGALAVGGRLIHPDFSSESLPVERTGAGRFEAVFPADDPGTYLVQLPYSLGEGQVGVARTGVVMSYSPEYRTLRDNEMVLGEIARRSGGRVLNMNQSDLIFAASSIQPVQVRRPFWEDVLRLVLLLFLLDVAVRRIGITPAEAVAGVRKFIRELAGRPATESAATLATLRDVKTRVRDDDAQARADDAARRAAQPAQSAIDELTRALGGVEADKPVVSAPAPRRRPPRTSASSYAARLLEAKRRARGDADEQQPPE
ncbi:MAG: VWA domain-containing protein [Phycisphaerae bacterium]|jgi:Mg-chelatase subunit ChlD/uncharacterized membrane protein